MTHRLMFRKALLAVAGALVGVGALIWSTDGSEIEVPDRPPAVTIQVTSIPTAEEPLPEIWVPALRPQAAAEPGRRPAALTRRIRPPIRRLQAPSCRHHRRPGERV